MAAGLTGWQTKIAVKCRENGLDIADIAAILGRSLSVIKEALELAGVDKPTVRTKRAERDARYREGYDAGYRSALYHVLLHGWRAAHGYSHDALLPWTKSGNGNVPPEVPRTYRRIASISQGLDNGKKSCYNGQEPVL